MIHILNDTLFSRNVMRKHLKNFIFSHGFKVEISCDGFIQDVNQMSKHLVILKKILSLPNRVGMHMIMSSYTLALKERP